MTIGGITTQKAKRTGRILAAATCLILMAGLLVPAALTAGEGEVTLTLRQVFTRIGSTEPPSETFNYRLTPAQANNPMPSGSNAGGYSFTVRGTNDANIGPIRFTNPGEYEYEISHTTASAPGYTYDQERYTLKILVERDLTASVLAYNAAGFKAAMQYAHAYNHDDGFRPSDPKLMTDPPIVKTVSGNPSKPSAFTFKLAAGKPTNPMPAGSANGVKSVQINGSGQTEFGTWSYTTEGTYYYTVSEVASGVSGYTYDTMTYTITDSVKAVNGQLVVTRVVTNNANKQVTALTFINKYSSSSGGGGSDGPKTGDDADVNLYAILFCAAGVAALGSVGYLVLAGRRRRKDSK